MKKTFFTILLAMVLSIGANANEKRDDFKNIDSRERIESISNLFSDINVD